MLKRDILNIFEKFFEKRVLSEPVGVLSVSNFFCDSICCELFDSGNSSLLLWKGMKKPRLKQVFDFFRILCEK